MARRVHAYFASKYSWQGRKGGLHAFLTPVWNFARLKIPKYTYLRNTGARGGRGRGFSPSEQLFLLSSSPTFCVSVCQAAIMSSRWLELLRCRKWGWKFNARTGKREAKVFMYIENVPLTLLFGRLISVYGYTYLKRYITITSLNERVFYSWPFIITL